jgi:hypothetical protein
MKKLDYFISKGRLKMAEEEAGRELTFLELERLFNSCFQRSDLDGAREVAMKMEPNKRVPFINKVNHGSNFLPGYIELNMLDEFVRTCNLAEGRDEFHGLV